MINNWENEVSPESDTTSPLRAERNDGIPLSFCYYPYMCVCSISSLNVQVVHYS